MRHLQASQGLQQQPIRQQTKQVLGPSWLYLVTFGVDIFTTIIIFKSPWRIIEETHWEVLVNTIHSSLSVWLTEVYKSRKDADGFLYITWPTSLPLAESEESRRIEHNLTGESDRDEMLFSMSRSILIFKDTHSHCEGQVSWQAPEAANHWSKSKNSRYQWLRPKWLYCNGKQEERQASIMRVKKMTTPSEEPNYGKHQFFYFWRLLLFEDASF